eukprot:TRINITY_DN4076_c0_g1_i5.p5 TRINITY_DN4076_c0_g1~~TRINITY_DN4076_c0_g1_i5.p5  ORF type:complete len:170 (+),score=43.47 TRINITY_DN4076_c0_g1_i5:834-1343(+)
MGRVELGRDGGMMPETLGGGEAGAYGYLNIAVSMKKGGYYYISAGPNLGLPANGECPNLGEWDKGESTGVALKGGGGNGEPNPPSNIGGLDANIAPNYEWSQAILATLRRLVAGSFIDLKRLSSLMRQSYLLTTTYLAAAATPGEEHTSELQSHYSISYAVFCLKKKKK